jgi:ABC-2 type transport system ATP-binding protein
MRELLARGVPLIFVSHNLAAIVDLCTRAILIDHGIVQFDGSPAAAVNEFRRAGRHAAAARVADPDRPIQISDVRLLHADGTPSPLFQTGAAMTIQVGYRAQRDVVQPHVAIDIHGADGVYCAGINTRMDQCQLGTLNGEGHVELVIPRLALLPGSYTISAGILDPKGGRPLDLHDRAYPFSVVSDRRDFGVVYLEHTWRHAPPQPSAPHRRRRAGGVAVQEDLR